VTSRVAMLRRCLSILPDSGNPVILAGFCWWRQYACLLHNAGLLTGIRKVASKEAMSFGDAAAVVPHFILLQVLLWYRYKTQGVQSVFTDIRIVPNEVVLLDGKHNMAALNLSMALSATVGKTSYYLRTTALRIVDSGSNFLVRLAKPRPFRENERGIAVVHSNGGAYLRAVIVPASYNFVHHEVAHEPAAYTDDFPELVAPPGSSPSHSLDYCTVRRHSICGQKSLSLFPKIIRRHKS
jgi:hypothetical protein